MADQDEEILVIATIPVGEFGTGRKLAHSIVVDLTRRGRWAVKLEQKMQATDDKTAIDEVYVVSCAKAGVLPETLPKR